MTTSRRGSIPFIASTDSFVRAAALRGVRELRVPASFAPALDALGDADPQVRREAVAVLGYLKRAEALPALTSIASADPAPEVRRAAAGALGYAAATSDQQAVLAALLAALTDAEWQVREEAATTLGKIRHQAAAPALIAALDDAYWQVRLRAARSLGRLRSHDALPGLIATLTHTISNLRKEAALALGEIASPLALPALHQAAGDPDPEVRKSVRLAIQQTQDAA